MARFLISFDIDGTLEIGDPPGPITLDMVRRAREHGFLIGSCSDRTATSQRAIWERLEMEADFIALKHMLDDVKERFEADRYLHIGDRDMDQQFAEQAGFDFMWEHEAHTEPWLAWLNEAAEVVTDVEDNVGSGAIAEAVTEVVAEIADRTPRPR